jgi:hypothetical protein
MKITSKVVMINVEHSITVGKNDAITLDVIHQVWLSEGKNGEVDADVDFVDYSNVKFLGMDIDSGYKGFREFKEQMLRFGIDVDELIDEECARLITTGDIQKLKNEYRDLVK